MPPQEDYSGVSEMEILLQKLSQIFGDSGIAAQIVQAFTPKLEQYLGASARFGGNNSNPYAFGAQGMFAPTDVGSEFFIQAQRDVIQTVYEDANIELNKAREKFTSQAASYMFGGPSATGSNAFGLLAGAGFARLQTDQLLAGIGSGGRYMGIMAGFGGADDDRLGIARNMATGLAADFPANISAYGGMRGRDVGIVYSELARTGGFSDILSGDDSAEDIKAKTVALVQKTSQSISEFRSVFQGSVTQVMDSVNSLLGTDVAATFDDAGRSLAQRLGTTGFVTSTSPSQLQAAMAESAGLSNRAGLGSLNSASAAMLFAEQEAVGRVTGTNKFINSSQYRRTLLKQTTGAMYSDFARDISGAYAIDEEQKAIIQAGVANGEIRSLSDIAEVTGLSAEDIRAAGFSQEAATLRAEDGVGGLEAMRGGIAALDDTRRNYLTRVYGAEAVSGITGPMTMSNIAEGLGLDVAGRGALRRAFGVQARAMGFQGAEALDKYASSIRNDAELGRIRDSIQEQTEFKDAVSGKGKAFGLGAIIEMAQSGDLANSDKNIYRLLTGNADLEGGDFKNYFSGLEGLQKGGGLAADSASLAASALVTNKIAGNRMTADQQLAARAIFSAETLEDQQSAARAFAAKVSAPGELNKSMIEALTESEGGLNGVSISDKQDAAKYLALGAIGSLDKDSFEIAGLDDDQEASFFETAAAYREALKTGGEFKFGEKGMMSRSDFMKAYGQTAREKKNVYDAAYEDENTDWTAKLIAVLNTLASLLGLMVNNPAGDQGTVKTGGGV